VSQLTEFDFGILRQQDVLALDVAVDNVVGVKVGQTLSRRRRRKKTQDISDC